MINAGSSAFDVYKGQLELGKNLAGEGRKIGDAAHHIIQKGKRYAEALGSGIELARQCFSGGGIENKASGAWLDPKLHGRVHTQFSRDNLKVLFDFISDKSPDPCNAFRSVMEEIKQCLQAFARQWDDAIYLIAQEVLGSGPISTRQIYQLRRGKTGNSILFKQKLDAKINSGQLKTPDYINKNLGTDGSKMTGKLCGG